jgi:alanine dehydrogenase
MGVSVGLPRIHRERGERRDFLPSLVRWLDAAGVGDIVLEHGYGSGMLIPASSYAEASDRVRLASYAECMQQDIVVVLRCPADGDLEMLRPGAVFLSMLHFSTRVRRARLLLDMGVRAVSLDALLDEAGRRTVENLDIVAWNGTREAFRQIRLRHPNFEHPSRRPLHVTCLGAGAVGGRAVHAAMRYGDPELHRRLATTGVRGVEGTVVDADLTGDEDYMLSRLETTDLLIDATHRLDAGRPVVPNAWLAALPADAVILDLAADPYELDGSPPVTKAIEGIPQGDLDTWLFPVGHPAWDRTDPRVDRRNRRVALSCYSWPGLDPPRSMRVYGTQLEPVLQVVLDSSPDSWEVDGPDHQERAVARAEVSRWLRVHG